MSQQYLTLLFKISRTFSNICIPLLFQTKKQQDCHKVYFDLFKILHLMTQKKLELLTLIKTSEKSLNVCIPMLF